MLAFTRAILTHRNMQKERGPSTTLETQVINNSKLLSEIHRKRAGAHDSNQA
jgi:hypothetical protein